MQIVLMAIVGLAAGVLSVLLGVGGGIIMVPALAYIGGLDFKLATGTSLAVIIPTAITGVFKRAQVHQVDWRVALLVAVGAVAGAMLGAKLNEIISTRVLKQVFAALLIFTAVRMFLDAR